MEEGRGRGEEGGGGRKKKRNVEGEIYRDGGGDGEEGWE